MRSVRFAEVKRKKRTQSQVLITEKKASLGPRWIPFRSLERAFRNIFSSAAVMSDAITGHRVPICGSIDTRRSLRRKCAT